jgi:hypothetical protein
MVARGKRKLELRKKNEVSLVTTRPLPSVDALTASHVTTRPLPSVDALTASLVTTRPLPSVDALTAAHLLDLHPATVRQLWQRRAKAKNVVRPTSHLKRTEFVTET